MDDLIKNISNIMRKWKAESSSESVLQYRFFEDSGVLCVYTSNIGLYIGSKGNLYDKYTQIFKNEIPQVNEIDFMETNDTV